MGSTLQGEGTSAVGFVSEIPYLWLGDFIHMAKEVTVDFFPRVWEIGSQRLHVPVWTFQHRGRHGGCLHLD